MRPCRKTSFAASRVVETSARYAHLPLVHQRRLEATGLRDSIRNLDNEAYLSAVSVWEAIVKHRLGKLSLPEAAERYLPEQRKRHMISSLALDEPSVARLGSLPSLHRDPFDRMLICQALQHELVIATVDRSIREYPVTVL